MILATGVDGYAHKLRALEVDIAHAQSFLHSGNACQYFFANIFVSTENIQFFAGFVDRDCRQTRQFDLVNEWR